MHVVKMFKLLDSLIISWDQTGCQIIPYDVDVYFLVYTVACGTTVANTFCIFYSTITVLTIYNTLYLVC